MTESRTQPRARGVRPGSLPPLAVDALLAVGLTAVVTMASLVASEPGGRPPGPASFLLGGTLGCLVLLRRRWPVTVLLLSAACVVAYHLAGFPGIGSSWPLSVALFTCAANGRLRLGALISVGLLAAAAWWRLGVEGGPPLAMLTGTLQELVAAALVLALGEAVRSRRGWSEEVHERLRRVEWERGQEAERRITAERVRIARELHDIMAHTLAMSGIQLNVAAETLDDPTDEARTALRTAQQVNREAMAELKAAVRVLRQGQQELLSRSPAPQLGDVEKLLDMVREAGLRVEYEKAGEQRSAPPAVGLTVYRLVQESLTNVLRHAGAATVRVWVCHEPAGVTVRVIDDGRGPPGDSRETPGHGLTGLRERVLGLGGDLTAGPGTDNGFAVHAWLPTESR